MKTCIMLNPHVNVKSIVIALLDRLVAYSQRESEMAEVENESELASPGIPEDVPLFYVFWEKIQEILRVAIFA